MLVDVSRISDQESPATNANFMLASNYLLSSNYSIIMPTETVLVTR
jgi:hypothetical protein